MKAKLSFKVLFGIVGLLAVGLLLVGYIMNTRKNMIVAGIYHDQSLLIATSLDASISEIDMEDSDLLQQQVYKYTWLNPDVLHLSISRWENDNLVIAASTEFDRIGDIANNENFTAYTQNQPSSNLEEIDEEQMMRIISPIHLGGKVVGTYNMALSVKSRNEYIRESVRELIIIILVTMISVILAMWILLRTMVVRPIYKLVKDVKKFGEGHLDKRAVVNGNDEIAMLAHGFNKMAEQIQNSQEELEVEIKKQTQELELAKSDLEDQGLAILNVLEDVSEEKEYESLRSKSLLETVNEGIAVVNDGGLVEYINPAFENLFGFSEKVLKGKILADELGIYDLKDEKLPAKFLSSSAVVTQSSGETKLQIESKSKEKIAVSISAAPIYQASEFKGVVMVFHDFSEDLQLSRQKDDFFSIASHELRTPLTVMSGNLDMIIGGMGGSKLTKEDRSMLADTLESSDRLIRMVSDFLNVSRIDQGRLVMHDDEINMCDLVESVVKNYHSMVDDKGIELLFKCTAKNAKVIGDEDKLREVIINLLGNSLKFTSKGEIKIEMEVKKKMMEIRVSDTGMGIAKDRQKLLFHRFQQAMSRTLAREAGGTGLGLYISREFMRLMGGELSLISSKKGKGSTFAFTIPLASSSK